MTKPTKPHPNKTGKSILDMTKLELAEYAEFKHEFTNVMIMAGRLGMADESMAQCGIALRELIKTLSKEEADNV